MKRILIYELFIFFHFFICEKSSAQISAAAQVYSGYGMTAYNMKEYKPSGYMPLGIRGAIGFNGIQIGPDLWTSIMNPSFKLSDSTGNYISTEKISDTYIGGMFRIYAGDDPRDFAIVLRAGCGIYLSKKSVAYSDYYKGFFPNISDGTYKFNNSIGYNGSIGFSLPIKRTNIHFTLEGQFNYNPRKYNNTTNFHTTWNIQAGVAYNFFNKYMI